MEHLTVKNFGPVSDLDISLKKINVFIGEQGTGKSTVAKLLSCCRDMNLHYMISHEHGNDKINEVFLKHGIAHCFRENTYIDYRSILNDSNIRLVYRDKKFVLSYPEGIDAGEATKQIVNNALYEMLGRLGYPVNDKTDTKELKVLIERHEKILNSHLRTSFYCPAERSLTSIMANSISSMLVSEIPLPYMLLEFTSFFEKAREHYKVYNLPFLGLRYEYYNGENLLRGDSFTIQLKNASSGIQAVLPMLMVIEFCLEKNYFNSFIVEEPELNLFPTNQLHLLQTLISKIHADGRSTDSILLTTHSPYILSGLNLSLLAGKIIREFPGETNRLKSLFSLDYAISPDDIAAYAFSKEGPEYVTNVLNEKTRLIKANFLDAISDVISSKFNEMFNLYMSMAGNVKNK